MQRRPSLIVNLVHVGTTIHKEGHHVHAAVYAGLERRQKRNEMKQLWMFGIGLSINHLFQFNLVESSNSICIGTVDDFCHILPVAPVGLFVLQQHQLGLLCVPTGTGSQELRSPVEPHPFTTDRGYKQLVNSLL